MTTSNTATAFLSLMKIKDVGRRKAFNILKEPIGDSDLACGFDALEARISHAQLNDVPSTDDLRIAWTKSVEQIEQGRSDGIQALSYHDEGYPERLRNIPDPPAVLFVKGDLKGLYANSSLAVVGTREPTPFGIVAAQSSARIAAELGFAIVSGLAHGCDTLAHEGCLEAQGVGIAVLAHGLDKVYPAANRKLAERLLDMGGCLVSEYPIGTKPIRLALVERDRIQSGLSDAVLVVETDIHGGTMHTVKYSKKQKRKLACIAHTKKYIEMDKTKGNQKLIRDGCAEPIRTDENLSDYLKLMSKGDYHNMRKNNATYENAQQLSLEL